MQMELFSILFLWIFLQQGSQEKTRILEYNGSMVNTTYSVDQKFLGRYDGSKQGFLLLKDDGNGVYQYDYPMLSDNCQGENIEFKWGFIVDDDGEVVRFKRSYGFSYPIIYNCSGENAFRGCTARSMVDYILEYENGTITISSSDDWEKNN